MEPLVERMSQQSSSENLQLNILRQYTSSSLTYSDDSKEESISTQQVNNKIKNKKISKKNQNHVHTFNCQQCNNCSLELQKNHKLKQQIQIFQNRVFELKKKNQEKENSKSGIQSCSGSEEEEDTCCNQQFLKKDSIFVNKQEQSEFENGMNGYYYSPFCENDQNNYFEFSRNLQHNFKTILQKLENGKYNKYFSHSQIEIENKLYKLLKEILANFSIFKYKFNAKFITNSTKPSKSGCLSIIQDFHNQGVTKLQGRSKRQPKLMQDSDRLTEIIEQIADKLNIRIKIRIDVQNFLPLNYLLETDKNLVDYHLGFSFKSFKEKNYKQNNFQIVPISEEQYQTNPNCQPEIHFVNNEQTIQVIFKNFENYQVKEDKIQQSIEFNIGNSYLDKFSLTLCNNEKDKIFTVINEQYENPIIENQKIQEELPNQQIFPQFQQYIPELRIETNQQMSYNREPQYIQNVDYVPQVQNNMYQQQYPNQSQQQQQPNIQSNSVFNINDNFNQMNTDLIPNYFNFQSYDSQFYIQN